MNVGARFLLSFAFSVLLALPAAAAPGFTYAGRLLDSSDQPVTSTDVYFTSTIYDEDSRCTLYTETRLLDLSASAGTFAFNVGSSDSDLVPSSASYNGSATSMTDVFDNKKTITGLTGCSSGANTYTASTSTSPRMLEITFKVGAGGPVQSIPVLRINPVPSALQAYAVNGYGSEHLLKVAPAAIAASAVSNTALTQAQYEEFWKLILGTSTTFVKSSNVGTAANNIVQLDGSGKLPAVDGSQLTNLPATGVTSLNGSTQATQTFAFTTAGVTTPDWSTVAGTGVHSLRIPMASTAAVTAGLLSKADYDTFNSKQSATLADTKIWIGNGSAVAAAQSLSGDITSLTNAGVVTATKTTTGEASKLLSTDASGVTSLKGLNLLGSTSGSLSLTSAATTANYSLKFPAAAPTAGQILSSDASGNFSWVTPVTANGSGNVGIGTSNPSDTLEVNGSVRVNQYIYTWNWSNSVYASTSASLGIPNSPGIAVNNPASVDGTIGMLAVTASNTAGNTQKAYFGAVSNNAGYSPDVVIGHQTGATAYAERMRITSAGYVGIGTSSPSKTLSVNGDIESNTLSSTTVSAGTLYAGGIALNGNAAGAVMMSIRNNTANGLSGISFQDTAGATTGGVGYSNSSGVLFPSSMFLTTSTAGVPMIFGIQNIEAARIGTTGNFGIGNNNPTYKLDVTGDINTTTGLRVGGVSMCTAAGCTSSSDRNLKENIKTLDGSLEKILKLRGVSYDWKDKEKYGAKEQVGVIAQELEEVYPGLVYTDARNGQKSVAYGNLAGPLIESTRELYGMCKDSERRIASLEKENSEIKAENAMIKAYLCAKDPKAPFCK